MVVFHLSALPKEVFFGKEVGSPVNQAGQRAVRNGWLASCLHLIITFSWGGFYQPRWIDGSMWHGAVFAILALTVPLTMAIVSFITYKRHYRKLRRAQYKRRAAESIELSSSPCYGMDATE